MNNSFATLDDVIAVSGRTFTVDEQNRIETLLPLVSALIQNEGMKVNKDITAMVALDDTYANVVKLVTCDVVIRVMRQSTTGEPMAQESQSALGYSWSGSYAVPGGGVAMSLMNNEKKMLGIRQQRYGAMDTWEGEHHEHD